MSIEAWESILSTFEVQGDIAPVASEMLDRFTADTGFQLPVSFREFCMTFGPCRLMDSYRFAVPGGLSPYYDILVMNEEDKAQYFERNYLKDVAQFERSWLFATDTATSFFFWDPLDITDAANCEYGVYVIYREYKVQRLADTFWSFINDVCMGLGVPDYQSDEPEERVFEAPTE